MPKPTPASIHMVKQRTQKARSRARVIPRTSRPLSEISDQFAIYALVFCLISQKGHGSVVPVVRCITHITPSLTTMGIYIMREY